MALLGNYSRLQKSFERTIGGVVASGNRSNWNTSGAMRNWGKQTGLDWKLTAVPKGHGAGGAWMLPKTAGGMTSRREARLSIGASGNGALGMGMVGQADISVSAEGIGGLIAGGVGVATISIGASGSITATIGSTGLATISMGGSGNLGALGWLVGESTIAIDGALVSYAKGHMVGSTAESGLSVAGITNAVWNAVLANYQEDGTAGKALSTASSGGVDLEALAQAVLDSLLANNIPVNVKKVNDVSVKGTGTAGDEWGPV